MYLVVKADTAVLTEMSPERVCILDSGVEIISIVQVNVYSTSVAENRVFLH